jgi:predicted ATPase
MITVIGGAGMGKSRLLDEFTIWIEDRPEEVWFFKGRASQERQGMPYALLRDVFAFRFQIQDSDPLPAVKEKMQAGVSVALGEGEGARMRAHFIGQLLGFDFSDSPYIKGILDNAQQIRDRALAYAGDYFKAVAVHRPNVILLEDIHWADDVR